MSLIQDLSPELYKEDQYRYALNTVPEDSEGNQFKLFSEPGNLNIADLPSGYRLVGGCHMEGDESAVFITDGTNSEIGILTPSSYTTHVNNTCLGFKHQIKCEYKKKNGCDRVVIWIDGVKDDSNPPRYFDFDNPDDFKTDDDWDCGKFKLFNEFDIPQITTVDVNNTGGSLPVGVLYFTLQYSDSQFANSEYFKTTNPIPITKETRTNDWRDVDGGTVSIEGYASKSVDINIENIDTRYDFLNIVAIHKTEGIITPYLVDKIAITGSTMDYTYTGLNAVEDSQLNLTDITQSRVVYDRAEDLDQMHRKLILANLREKDINLAKFQQKANNIATTYITKKFKYLNASTGPKSEDFYKQFKSLMRDEVYGLGVRYTFADGHKTPYFHIPGRTKDVKSNLQPFSVTDNTTSHSRPAISNYANWDSEGIESSAETAHLNHCSSGSTTTTCGPVDFSFTISQEGSRFKFDYTASETVTFSIGAGYVDRDDANNSMSNTFGDTGTSGTIYMPLDFGAIVDSNAGVLDLIITFTTDSGSCSYEIENGKRVSYFNGSYPYTKSYTVTSPDETIATAERWQVYNTATRSETGTDFYSKGELGYYEVCGINYPDTTCDGKRVYPEGPIRHHKMPDTTLEPHFEVDGDDEYIITLGLEFSGVQYPAEYADEIVGHEFAIVRRDEQNKTVLDKGIIYQNVDIFDKDDTSSPLFRRQTIPYNIDERDVTEILAGTTFNTITTPEGVEDDVDNATYWEEPIMTETTDSFSVHSPITKFDKTQLLTNYLKVEKELIGTIDVYAGLVGPSGIYGDLSGVATLARYHNHELASYTNRLVTADAYLEADKQLQAGVLSELFYNQSQQEAYVVELQDDLLPPTGTDDSDQFADSTVSRCYYVGIKQVRDTINSNLANLTYIPLSDLSYTGGFNTVYGGDTFISKLAFRKTFQSYEYNLTLTPFSYPQLATGAAPWFFVESEINCDLRHSQDETNADYNYFPKHYRTQTEITNWLKLDHEKINYFFYSDDFSSLNDIFQVRGIDIQYFCQDCANKFPYRLIYSQDDIAELVDLNRVFLPNNYKDIPAHTGAITEIFDQRNALFLRTTGSLFQQPTQVERLQSENSIVSIGSGEFLEVDPIEVTSSNNEYAGGLTKYSTLTNENGTLIINDLQGKVFMLTDKLMPVGELNEIWLRENLPTKFYSEFKSLTGIEFQRKDEPLYFVGVTSGYDNEFDRFLITKKDYKIIPETFGGLVSEVDSDEYNGKVVWNETNHVFQLVDDYNPVNETFSLTNLSLDNSTYFENKSFTISYSPKKKWLSFHSYLPPIYINGGDSLYTDQDSKVYLHNEGDFQNYYGTKYPMVVEMPRSQGLATYHTLAYMTNAWKLNTSTKQWELIPFDTFDEVVFYNSHQSSGLLSVEVNDDPFETLNYAADRVYARRTKSLWTMSSLKDISKDTNYSLFTEDWDNTDYRTNYPIDKYPDVDAVDYTKPQFEISPMKDKYLTTRFFYHNDNNYKLEFIVSEYNVRAFVH